MLRQSMILISLTAVLGGCALMQGDGGLNLNRDWSEIGHQEGLRGRAASRLSEVPAAERDRYLARHREGLAVYCGGSTARASSTVCRSAGLPARTR